MILDRRRALVTLAGGAAAATLTGRPAEALYAGRTTSILLYNRSTGAWLVQSPGTALNLPGVRSTGSSAARFAGRPWAVGVFRRFRSAAGDTTDHYGVLTLRGSSTVTPSWEVSAFTGGGWTRRNGGRLTFNGAPWIPAGQLLEYDNDQVVTVGARRSARIVLSVTSSALASWSLRISDSRSLAQPVDTAFAMATPTEGAIYGMARGGTLTRFYDANRGTGLAPRLVAQSTLATIRGHVYGPVPTSGGLVLLVYDRTSGAAQFVSIGTDFDLTRARIVLSGTIAAGWTHVVPYQRGWFFYHRTRRCAQLAGVAPQLDRTGTRWVLINGYLWPDGTMPDFTDAVGFGSA